MQVAQENFHRYEFQFDRSGSESGALAAGQVFGDQRQGNLCRVFDALALCQPRREPFQRPAHGKLVIIRKAALCGEVADELLDQKLHEGKMSDTRRAKDVKNRSLKRAVRSAVARRRADR